MDHRPAIEQIASLLDPAERQAVLGDIEERGPSFRALLDLMGLVILRQLQAWKNWRPWALTAAIYLPLFFAVACSIALPQVLYSGRLLRTFTEFGDSIPIAPWHILGVPALAWLAGYCLGAIGNHRTASVLLPCTALTVWFADRISRTILSVLRPPAWPLTDEGWRGTGSHEAVVIAITLIVMIPCLRGYLRGLNPRPLALFTAIAMTALTAPATASLFTFMGPRYAWLRVPAALWPIAYVFAARRRTAR